MKYLIAALVVGTALSSGVLAHEAKGMHGGRVVDAGSYHVELVVAGPDISVFVTDSADKAVDPTGFKGSAILVSGGKTHRVSLAVDGAKLIGKAEAALGADTKGVVQLTLPNGATAQGQFK